MTDKQLATLESMPDQILPLCAKLGGRYENWTEADLHRLAFEKKITLELRGAFREYDGVEPYRAIGFFIKLKAALQKMWTAKWQTEKAEREQNLFADQNIIETAYTWERVIEWMRIHDTFHKPVERLEFVKTVQRISYWKLRDTMVARLTHREAMSEYEAYGFESKGYTFQQLYEPCREIGHDGQLFKRMFDFGVSEAAQ